MGAPEGADAADASASFETFSSASPAEAPCPFRDPEDGGCFRTADEADIAWIARGSLPPRSPRVALPPGLPAILAEAREQAEELPFEEDFDEDEEAETTLWEKGSVATARLPSLSDEQRTFWQTLGSTLKGFVVRKTDSKPASIPEEELAVLFATGFPLPIEAFPKEKLRDTFKASRGRHRKHHAIDLGAPRGTPILAVSDGTIERLGRDRRGGIVIYQRDATGRFVYFYAHLSRYAPGLKVGARVKRGERIGEVGSTGRSSAPHLHFAIFRDTDAPNPGKGLVVNPYLVFSTLIGGK
ncbi:MAG: M23 family metallopeptidase [Thermoanaerobaculia bacterium]|nr:M23 family metallopeptidase [Thermoanaerobaculia bacterium]